MEKSGQGFSLKSILRRTPIFIQYMISFLVLMAVFFAVSMLISRQAQSIARQNYVDERNFSLESSSNELIRQIDEFRSVYLSMQTHPYYVKMRLFSGENVTALQHYMMSRLQEAFVRQCQQIQMGTGGFIYFKNSGAVLGANRISFDVQDYLSHVLRLNAPDAEELLARLSVQGSTPLLFPVQSMQGVALEGNYALLLFAPPTESTVYGIFIKESELKSIFKLAEMPQGTLLTLLNPNKGLLYESAPPQDTTYETLSVSSAFYAASLQIPNAYFTEMTAPISALNKTYLAGMLLMGVALSLLFSWFFRIPVRRLLTVSLREQETDPDPSLNEFERISGKIEHTNRERLRFQAEAEKSREALRLNLLARLLEQENFAETDEPFVLELLPILAGPVRVLSLKLYTEENLQYAPSYYCSLALNKAQPPFPENSFPVQMRTDLWAMLLPDCAGFSETLSQTLSSMQETLSAYGASLAAGASEAVYSPHALHEAWQHAQFCLQYFAPPLPVFESKASKEPFQFSDLQKFHSAVLAGEEISTLQLLDKLCSHADKNPWIISAAHFIVQSVYKDLDSPNIQDTSARPAPEEVRRETETVLRKLNERKNQYADTLLASILQYLEEEYHDASLSVDGIAAHFGISKSYLYHLFRESVRITPSDKLEQIRIGHARSLLTETSKSIQDIAALCGYHSSNTFYKAYKKIYGVSPSTFRQTE